MWSLCKIGLYFSFVNLLALKSALAIMCYICGQTNLLPPGECTAQFQYDCSTADPNQPQNARIGLSKMICRTTRSRISPNIYSVGKECVTEDEHLNRYPEAKGYGCDVLYPNTTNEVSYCVCDQDLCNGRSINDQIQLQLAQASLLTDRSVNISVAAPLGANGNNIPLFPPQVSLPVVQGRDKLIPAPLQSPTSLPVNNINAFGRTPPGTDPASALVQNNNIPDHEGILVPPLILPNNSIPLPPYPSTLPPPVVSTRLSETPNGPPLSQPARSINRNVQEHPQASLAAVGQTAVNDEQDVIPLQEEFNVVPVQPGSTVQGIQRQLRPTFNWTSLEQIRRENGGNIGESFIEQQQQQTNGRSQWPIQTVQNHLVAEPTNQKNQESRQQPSLESGGSLSRNSSSRQPTVADLSLKCVTCAETNLTAGSDCRKQIPVDCSRQYSADSKVFCFTKETVLLSGLRTVEKRCASGESLAQDLGLQVIRESCGQTRPQSPQEFRYCICSADSCNQISLQQQLVLYANLIQSAQVPNPWIQNQQQQLAGGFTQQIRQTTSGQKTSTTTISEGPEMHCYVCGESDMQHAADCTQQYDYNCHHQYPPNSNAKVLCLTRQTKLSSGLFSIEKRCIAESEHKQQYPGSQVVLNGCGEAWNGYVQYCVCSDAELCNGPNITTQQHNRGYTPTDLHQQTDPFITSTPSPPPSPTVTSSPVYKRNQTSIPKTIPSSSTISSQSTTTTITFEEITKLSTNFLQNSRSTPPNKKQQTDEDFEFLQKKSTSSKQGNWERQRSQSGDGCSNKNYSTLQLLFITSFLFVLRLL